MLSSASGFTGGRCGEEDACMGDETGLALKPY